MLMDQRLAREVALLFAYRFPTSNIDDHHEAREFADAIAATKRFVVEQNLYLPPSDLPRFDGVRLIPDISIAGVNGKNDPTFQLLIEAKVDARFRKIKGLDQQLALRACMG